MFGISRGAYVVRCVAGMINNCGVVRQVTRNDGTVDEEATELLCRRVYGMYRSKNPLGHPRSPQSLLFRQGASWPLIGDPPLQPQPMLPPVQFIGAFDTVGSLGIPDFVGGVGLDWPQFHDQFVSTAVEHVAHAVSLHDTFYAFPPCLAYRKVRGGRDENYNIKQKWFPGTHYDLARQRFRFLRVSGGCFLERLFAWWNWASMEIRPNRVLSDLVLNWMLHQICENDPHGYVIPTAVINQQMQAVNERIVARNRDTGDGDVYRRITEYAPFGRIILWIWTTFWGTKWRSQIYQLFFAVRDRTIADLNADVYDYQTADLTIAGAGTTTIQQLAALHFPNRYPSQTYASWRLGRRVSRL